MCYFDNFVFRSDAEKAAIQKPQKKFGELCADGAEVTPVQAGKATVHLDSYQTNSEFVVTVSAKNLMKEEVTVEFGSESLRVRAKLLDGTYYENDTTLNKRVDPHRCSFKVTNSKIEIKLCKLDTGLWPALEAESVAAKELRKQKQMEEDSIKKDLASFDENFGKDPAWNQFFYFLEIVAFGRDFAVEVLGEDEDDVVDIENVRLHIDVEEQPLEFWIS